MAVSLQLKFGTLAGVKTYNFKNAKAELSNSNVVNLMQAMITNGSIYKNPPMTAESAKLVVTTESEFDVSGVTPANNA